MVFRLAVSSIVWLLVSSHASADEFTKTLISEWGSLASLDNVDKAYQVTKSIVAEKAAEKFTSKATYDIVTSSNSGLRQGGSSKVTVCWNPQYSFNLKASKVDAKSWLLGELIQGAPQGNPLRLLIVKNGHDISFYQPLTGFFTATCDSLLNDGSMTITGKKDEGKLTRVDFRLKMSFSMDRAMEELFSGTMLLDPRNHFIVVEAELTRDKLPNPRIAKNLTMKRLYDVNDERLVAKSVSYYTPPDSFPISSYEYSNYHFGPSDPEVFKLSHYGLPEPVDESSKTLWRRLWLAASVFAALAVMSFVYMRRRKSLQQTP